MGKNLKSPNPKAIKDRFLFQMYTRLHGFKFKFLKNFWGGAHRAPSPDPSPRFISGCALGSGFALNSRALRALGSGFALNTRALCALDSGFALNLPLPKFWPGCAFLAQPGQNHPPLADRYHDLGRPPPPPPRFWQFEHCQTRPRASPNTPTRLTK